MLELSVGEGVLDVRGGGGGCSRFDRQIGEAGDEIICVLRTRSRRVRNYASFQSKTGKYPAHQYSRSRRLRRFRERM